MPQPRTHAQCWSHTRRHFEQALESEPTGVEQALTQIQALYAVEQQIRDQNLTGGATVRAYDPVATQDVRRLYTAHPKAEQLVFCKDVYEATLRRSMRQVHRAGEKLFVDYAGQSVPYGREGDPAQIFVAALGASHYTFACATAHQRLIDWTGALVRALEFVDGDHSIGIEIPLQGGQQTLAS